MKRRFDTLFVRLALTSLVVVLLVQIGGIAIVLIQRPKHDVEGYARGLQIAVETAHMHEQSGLIEPLDFGPPGGPGHGYPPGPNPIAGLGRYAPHPHPGPGDIDRGPPHGMDGGPEGPLSGPRPDDGDGPRIPPDTDLSHRPPDMGPMHPPRRVRYVDVKASEALSLPANPIMRNRLLAVLATKLPTGTDIRVDNEQPTHLWVRYPASARWIVMPFDEPPSPPIFAELSIMAIASIVLALIAAWQLQLPVLRVAQAARAFGRSRRLPPVEPSGPRELRELAMSFNDMMRRVEEAENSQAVMLAGVAHDLKSPLMRLRLRADLLDDISERQGFLRDVESLTHIVEQFLLFANESPEPGPQIEVDDALRAQYGQDETSDESDIDALFALSLHAGRAFRLPRTLIDRLIGNLVDNALDHGEPPVSIATRRDGDHWVIEIRDHGPGIDPAQINTVIQPFVRLDSSRGGEGHCGLGLAIVHRLTQQQGGECTFANAPDGGLVVTIRLPVAGPAGAAITASKRLPS
ncbi:ATP-binding protein [Pararobbsia silviterrae]|uniref:histidine kinase n=1 Tax=Pararobbsia silviterrae TaxID=1792498 RepID=A0A494XJ40_9BURK|nr:ATP-binding protein [Pararobbsia silviterrae]RKP48666.1 HAMP domain-containing protein [Pararobbsia silviterrae]